VTNHENKGYDLLLITFDDEKTTLNIILDELKKEQFISTSAPAYIK
jgi:hypothetical protein